MPPLEGWVMDDAWDAMILSAASERWQKVARIIAVVSERAANGKHFDAIATRIRALVDEGKLEAKGDLSRWRFSEVRHAQSISLLQGRVSRRRNPPQALWSSGGLRLR
jgi:hypothetical protein